MAWATGSIPRAADVVTVRARITALATVVAAIVLVLAAVALVKTLDAQLTKQGDGGARARAAELGETAAAGTLGAVLKPVTDDGLVQVLDADGRVLGSSPNLISPRPIVSPATHAESLHVITVTAPDDRETERYRIWRLARSSDAGVVTVLVGTSLESVSEATKTLRTALIVGVPLMLVLLAAGVWYVVGRALSRVDRIRREVDGIGDRDLSRRLEPGPPDEVGQLVQTMNAMLDRLDRSQQRQRDFVADASHELQSPLAAFRAQLEVARAHPDGADWTSLTADLLEDADRMEDLVHDLLLLATGETPLTGQADPTDLAAIARDEVARLDGRRPGIIVSTVVESTAPVLGDRLQLGRVVGNLLDNASRHAATRVDVRVGDDGGFAWVSVGDDGPGVPADQADKVFDRFYRGDESRARSRRGTGLGLAIARALSRRHGGDVDLVPGAPGARFVLRIPRREP
ncbi:MAG: Signal transduction histidine kinase [Nocardioides sp.]|nr:Signal transduction histidine kinase [Nocardioides sp.]